MRLCVRNRGPSLSVLCHVDIRIEESPPRETEVREQGTPVPTVNMTLCGFLGCAERIWVAFGSSGAFEHPVLGC